MRFLHRSCTSRRTALRAVTALALLAGATVPAAAADAPYPTDRPVAESVEPIVVDMETAPEQIALEPAHCRLTLAVKICA